MMPIDETNDTLNEQTMAMIKSRESYFNHGQDLFRLGKIEESAKYYQMGNCIKEDHLSLYNLGCIYYKQGKYKKAIFNLEKSKSLDSHFFKSALVAGLCYSRLDNIKAAENNFINVLMNDTLNRVALTALSILYYNQGKFRESLKLVNRITSKFTSAENIKNLKYDILLKSCLNENSTGEIKQLKNNSDQFKLYDKYIESVKVDIYTDKYGTIADKIKILEEKNEEDSSSLISLSLCHLFNGDTDSAIDYLFKARRVAAG